jgi:5-carboxymethyl-2-hydroxymuconate isomerase
MVSSRNGDHSKAVVLIQITLRAGRSVEQKRALYARIAELLGKRGRRVGRPVT